MHTKGFTQITTFQIVPLFYNLLGKAYVCNHVNTGLERNLYSNALGYLGGFTWRLLIVDIYMKHGPGESALQLVQHFFNTYAKYKWCTLSPRKIDFDLVTLNDESKKAYHEKYKLNKDKPFLMHIITPCYPFGNSNRNLTKCTMQYIIQEIQRAQQLLASNGTNILQQLAQASTFFDDYMYYIRIDAQAQDDAELVKWKGLLESKLAFWCRNKLEPQSENLTVILNGQAYQFAVHSQTYFVGLNMLKKAVTPLNFTGAVSDLITMCYEWPKRKDTMHLAVQNLKKEKVKELFK